MTPSKPSQPAHAMKGFIGLLSPLWSIRRTVADIKASAASLAALNEARRAGQQEREQAAQRRQAATIGMSPAELFEHYYNLNAWTAAELSQQALAACRTRRVLVAAAAVLWAGLLWAIATAPGWVLLFMVPCGGVGVAAAVNSALRYAWWELQLQQRSIFTYADFWRRNDALWRLVR